MIFLVDVSGYIHASAHKMKGAKLKNEDGLQTGIVYGVLRSLSNLCDTFQPAAMALCYDAGRTMRDVVYPEYKANRKRDPEIQEHLSLVCDLLLDFAALLPFVQVREQGIEADDVIAHISHSLAALCKIRCTIVTKDKDLHQLQRKRCNILGLDGRKPDPEFTPAQIVAYKVLVGDSSDNVKGVLGLGDKTARKLLIEFESLKEIMSQARRGNIKLGKMTYEEAKPIVDRNMDLMRLDGRLITQRQADNILQSFNNQLQKPFQIDRDALREKLQEYQFKSFLMRFTSFCDTFGCLER